MNALYVSSSSPNAMKSIFGYKKRMPWGTIVNIRGQWLWFEAVTFPCVSSIPCSHNSIKGSTLYSKSINYVVVRHFSRLTNSSKRSRENVKYYANWLVICKMICRPILSAHALYKPFVFTIDFHLSSGWRFHTCINIKINK